jgi:hypothetical protein
MICPPKPIKKSTTIPCIRCGLCCVAGPCYYGASRSKEDHSCAYVIFENGMAICSLLPDKIIENHVGIGYGCRLREDKWMLNYYRTTFTNDLIKLVNYHAAKD